MAENIYMRLREFMDQLPAGYPSTPTGVEIKILQKLFSPEQAELVMKLKKEPEDVSDIAGRTGIPESELAAKLEEMAQRGLIFRVRDGEKRLYQPTQFLAGLYEFQLNNLDREFCELFEEYLPFIGMSLASNTQQMRVIPLQSSLKSNANVAPYNRVREIVEGEELITVTQCICKKEQGIMGHPCEKPQEVCLMFGNFAQFYLDNNMARRITKEEALGVLDRAEEAGLVLSPSNTQHLEAICCCCTCCCPFVKGLKMAPRPAEIVQNNYWSTIDEDLCTGCEECIEVCPMEAIKAEDALAQVMEERCIGCGLCVAACPVEAISMKERKDKGAPPETFADTLGRIANERGVQ
jgi:Fe-S-cluster-containing hydrogenase component 2